jgi:hypothetical protein
MDQIAIDETQREYLDQLRERLADEHVGEYGHVRDRDALQYLIDRHEATEDVDTGSAVDNDSEQSDGAESEQSDDAESDETDAEQSEEEDAGDDAGSASRLERMMGLLDDHEDVWEQSESEEGRYAVTLPDGSTERVRTKDDVRALLFQHYD